jgi:PTH1 family peptidyl-tRNA hydrolase
MSILIAGLGNPGKEYAKTRHNVGFLVLDALAQGLQERWKADKATAAEVIETHYFDTKLILVKPQTFMNLSGQSIQALVNKFKIAPADVWVVADDATLPLGTLRVRSSGSSGGHNGLKSVIESLATDTFVRFKIGVDAPPDAVPLDTYVLQAFPKSQLELLTKSISKTKETLLNFVAKGVTDTSITV